MADRTCCFQSIWIDWRSNSAGSMHFAPSTRRITQVWICRSPAARSVAPCQDPSDDSPVRFGAGLRSSNLSRSLGRQAGDDATFATRNVRTATTKLPKGTQNLDATPPFVSTPSKQLRARRPSVARCTSKQSGTPGHRHRIVAPPAISLSGRVSIAKCHDMRSKSAISAPIMPTRIRCACSLAVA